MTIKEQENQLILNLNLEIVLTVIVWLVSVGLISYRLILAGTPIVLSPMSVTSVPAIKEKNLETLRTSIKSLNFNNLPVIRLEPFD